jgi:glucose/mannose transport system permease protein
MSAAVSHVSAGSARTARYVIYVLLGFFALVYLLPFFVMLVTSLKPLAEIQSGNMMALPQAPTLDAWTRAWGEACIGVSCGGIKGYFWNSIKMVVPAVAISTILGALNGYVLTKWQFPGHRLVFGLMLFACFIPFQAVLIPMARVLGILGLSNSTAGLVLVHVIYGLGFTTLFFRNYYDA